MLFSFQTNITLKLRLLQLKVFSEIAFCHHGLCSILKSVVCWSTAFFKNILPLPPRNHIPLNVLTFCYSVHSYTSSAFLSLYINSLSRLRLGAWHFERVCSVLVFLLFVSLYARSHCNSDFLMAGSLCLNFYFSNCMKNKRERGTTNLKPDSEHFFYLQRRKLQFSNCNLKYLNFTISDRRNMPKIIRHIFTLIAASLILRNRFLNMVSRFY